jgi:hypothetical protein
LFRSGKPENFLRCNRLKVTCNLSEIENWISKIWTHLFCIRTTLLLWWNCVADSANDTGIFQWYLSVRGIPRYFQESFGFRRRCRPWHELFMMCKCFTER